MVLTRSPILASLLLKCAPRVGQGFQVSQRPSAAVSRPTHTALRASGEDTAVLPSERAFRLVQFPAAVELQTASYRLNLPPTQVEEQTPRDGNHPVDVVDRGELNGGVEVVLTSMVHLADRAYYAEIMREASSYDRVLFELIAGPDVSGLDPDGRRTVTDYVYPTAEQVSPYSIL